MSSYPISAPLEKLGLSHADALPPGAVKSLDGKQVGFGPAVVLLQSLMRGALR
jgi:hypothetical protein